MSQKRSSPPKEFNVIAKENIHNYPYSNGNYMVNVLTHQNTIKSSEIKVKQRVKQLRSPGRVGPDSECISLLTSGIGSFFVVSSCAMSHRKCSNIPDLDPQHARSSPCHSLSPPTAIVWQTKMSPGIAKCPLVAKLPPH